MSQVTLHTMTDSEIETLQIATASRLDGIGEYYFSQKLRQIDELNKAGKNVINLGIGSPDMPPHPEVIKTLTEESAKPNVHAYQNYKGSPLFRNAIMAHFAGDEMISPEEAAKDEAFGALSPDIAGALQSLWTDINTNDNNEHVSFSAP